jgi:hypothetical protein
LSIFETTLKNAPVSAVTGVIGVGVLASFLFDRSLNY